MNFIDPLGLAGGSGRPTPQVFRRGAGGFRVEPEDVFKYSEADLRSAEEEFGKLIEKIARNPNVPHYQLSRIRAILEQARPASWAKPKSDVERIEEIASWNYEAAAKLRDQALEIRAQFLPELPGRQPTYKKQVDELINGGKKENVFQSNLKVLRDAKRTLDGNQYGRVKPSKGLREEIWERSKAPDGKVYDPSGVEIKPGEPWQAGHRPGHKFSDAQERAMREEWSEEMWKAYQRDPDIYRPERHRTNMGHMYEDEWYDLQKPARY